MKHSKREQWPIQKEMISKLLTDLNELLLACLKGPLSDPQPHPLNQKKTKQKKQQQQQNKQTNKTKQKNSLPAPTMFTPSFSRLMYLSFSNARIALCGE